MPHASTNLTPEAASAREGGLVYVGDADPGLSRRATATGFRYLDPAGKPVRDAGTLGRIRALAIPPAYREVWICRIANGCWYRFCRLNNRTQSSFSEAA